MKGRNADEGTHHRLAATRGQWCVERAVSTPSSCGQVCAVGAREGLRAVTFERVKRAMDEDEEMVELRDILTEGETHGEDVSTGRLKPYMKYIGELTLLDGVIFYGNRIVIPGTMRQEVLDILHKAHQGVEGMYHAAQHSVMWPGLYRDLEGIRSACDACNLNAKSNPKLPPRPIEDPE